MPSAYLQPQDYTTFGVPNATPGQVMQASVLMDGAECLRRPEGLIYVPDGAGQPCYMQALSPALSLASVGAISPGSNVSVVVTGPLLNLQIGDVLILDRMNASVTEACVVNAISGTLPGPLTAGLQTVIFAHGAACTMEYGLVITEQKIMPKDRPLTRLSRVPAVNVIGGTGRYGYGRRGDAGNYNVDDFNLLAALSKFGGPPAWEIWQPANCGIEVETGQLWVPAGIMLAYYSEVKVRYVAGFTYANLPGEVKLACSLVIQSMQMNPMYGNVKSLKTGETAIENFSATNISEDVKQLLRPWIVQAMG